EQLKAIGRTVIHDWLLAAEAEIALLAGRVDQARELARTALQYAESVDGIFARGLSRRALALVAARAREPDWDADMEKALEAFAVGHAVFEGARTQILRGLILERQGDGARAADFIHEGAQVFAAVGRSQEERRLRDVGIHGP